MTPEAQRIALAEWEGFEILSSAKTSPGCERLGRLKGKDWEVLPDYLNDLNATHGAWLRLKDHDKREFHIHLGLLLEKQTKEWNELGVLDQRGLIANATAPQRCEALLKTINLWKE